MYSMVLMAALTTSTAAPDCHYHSCGCGGYSSCYGCGGCYGCYGGCYGCCGGCYGCCGGCYGCYGGCYGTSCYGAYYGGCYGCYGGVQVVPGTKPEGIGAPMKKDEQSSIAPDRAKLVVELPADAKLFIDNQPMKTTSEKRSFNTPTLEKGQTYYYDLRAEVMRDGKPLTETKARPGACRRGRPRRLQHDGLNSNREGEVM